MSSASRVVARALVGLMARETRLRLMSRRMEVNGLIITGIEVYNFISFLLLVNNSVEDGDIQTLAVASGRLFQITESDEMAYICQ